jgi:hypothetical protein
MTTDLTGDFELGEDEFDWDVFVPDPDESDVHGQTAALEDDAELSLDDADFDWDGALRDDAEPEKEAEGEARAGAAYDRIVDTVRRSLEDEAPMEATRGSDADTVPVPGPVDHSETPMPSDREPEATGLAASFAVWLESEKEADHEPAETMGLQRDTTWTSEPRREPVVAFAEEPNPETEPELNQWLAVDELPAVAEEHAEPTFAFEPLPASEPSPPRFAEAGTTVGAVGSAESTVLPSSDTGTLWATTPAAPWDADDPASAHTGEDDEDGDDGAEKPKRSRVFKATVVLACLLLLAVAAAVAVRELHHPTTTTTAPPAHVTTPTQAVVGTSSAGTAASNTARVQAATDAVDSATTAASVGLTSLAAFPTPTNVETVINPYISSLQLYETFLSGNAVPAPAQPAATAAVAKIRQDLQFLETIDGLPPQQLGAFLVQFDTDATQLQTTLSTLEQDLRAPAS